MESAAKIFPQGLAFFVVVVVVLNTALYLEREQVIIYIWGVGGRGRERGRERIPRRLRGQHRAPRGAESRDPDIMT